jgi:hypothetical protein
MENIENEKRNWEAPEIITVNPEKTESGSYHFPDAEGGHFFQSTNLAS